MGIIEKWNKFARKSIYINSHFQIPAGRMIFTLLITLIEAITILLATGNIVGVLPLFSNMFLVLERQNKEDIYCRKCTQEGIDPDCEICKEIRKKHQEIVDLQNGQ